PPTGLATLPTLDQVPSLTLPRSNSARNARDGARSPAPAWTGSPAAPRGHAAPARRIWQLQGWLIASLANSAGGFRTPADWSTRARAPSLVSGPASDRRSEGVRTLDYKAPSFQQSSVERSSQSVSWAAYSLHSACRSLI